MIRESDESKNESYLRMDHRDIGLFKTLIGLRKILVNVFISFRMTESDILYALDTDLR